MAGKACDVHCYNCEKNKKKCDFKDQELSNDCVVLVNPNASDLEMAMEQALELQLPRDVLISRY